MFQFIFVVVTALVNQFSQQVEKIFQQHNLKVIADTNLVQTDFLDVFLNLNTGNFSLSESPMTIPYMSIFNPTTLLQSPNTYCL